jgi:hypothetical protein
VWPPDDPVGGYGDVDGGLTKTFMWEKREMFPRHFDLAFGQRGREEVYHYQADPACLNDQAPVEDFQPVRKTHYERMSKYLFRTRDPRETENATFFEETFKKFPRVTGAG